MTNEAFARIKIDQLLKDAAWRLTDGRSVRYEYPLDDGGRADYVLFDRLGRAVAVLEAKSTSVSLTAGEAQGRRYADLLGVPFIFLSNGEEIWFCDKGQDAHFRRVETVFSQDDLVRRKAARDIRRNPLDIPIDSRIAGGGGRHHQSACIETLCRGIVSGRRKMLVEMATGTGKTRTAAALIKRLFDANWSTRALFVVDRNTLAIQAEDAFAEHLPHLPCYRVPRAGRRFQDEKRVTIVTLQTLVNEYEKYSAGYFDLILIDECHRSTLARMFDDVFADKKPSPTTRHADFVVSGMGPDDSVDGNARIKRFENEPLPQILVSVNMLDTGLDCATVSSEDGRLVTCPPVVENGREFQARAAEELAGLPEGSIILEMLSDYAVMHD